MSFHMLAAVRVYYNSSINSTPQMDRTVYICIYDICIYIYIYIYNL